MGRVAKRRESEPRDYAAEMRSMIDAHTAHGPYSAVVLAEEIVGKLRATDADLLAGWLDLHAVQIMRTAIIEIDRTMRSAARARSEGIEPVSPFKPTARSTFSRAAKKVSQGDKEALGRHRTGWLETRFVVDGVRRVLADLTGTEVLQVAEDYHSRAEANLMEEAFLRAVAKRSGKRKVGDVFNNDKLDELRRSIAG